MLVVLNSDSYITSLIKNKIYFIEDIVKVGLTNFYCIDGGTYTSGQFINITEIRRKKLKKIK